MARLVEMGAVVSEGVGVTPECAAALALAAALHDPAFLSTATWAVAWHQRPGEMPEFVAASSDGSWVPQGVWLPAGVTLAHHDPAIDPAVRTSWEFLPPERVLASHARLLGSVPHVVVVRSVTPGTAARWPRSTVVVAVGAEPAPSPNPLADPTIGRHRLAVLSPDAWWPVVCALPEEQVAGAVRQVAEAVASAQAGAGGADADRLRAAAVGQVGRGPSPDLAAALAEAVVQARVAVMLAAQGEPPPSPPPHWNAGLRRAAAELRAWEALAAAAAPGPADRMRLAEVVTAASAAGLVTGEGAG